MDYKKHYRLNEPPFRLTPDPDFFFSSTTHREALETLLYAIRSGEGFIQITGTPGTGKTMLLRKVLQQINESVLVGLILHSNIKADDLLYVIMQDLGVEPAHAKKSQREYLITVFRDFLIKNVVDGKQVIIIVDEAQNLPDETLEELRMLSNLETEKSKLLQIILVGQLELEEKISNIHLRQLAQRITIRYRLQPLTKKETKSYIFHRLNIAANPRDFSPLSFKPGVINKIYKYTQGIPRLINIVCERSIMAAFVDGSSIINKNHYKKALLSIEGEKLIQDIPANRARTTALLFILFLTIGAWVFINQPLLKNIISVNLQNQLTAIHAFSSSKTSASMESIGNKTISRLPDKEKKIIAKEEIIPKQETVLRDNSPKSSTIIETIENKPISSFPDKQKNMVIKDEIILEQETVLTDKRFFVSDCVILPNNGEKLIIVNKNNHQYTSYYKEHNEIQTGKTLDVSWPYPSGIYMAGVSDKGDKFLFNPDISYLTTVQIENKKFWEIIKSSIQYAVTPVIVLDDLEAGPSVFKREISGTEELEHVRKIVQNWLSAWNDMDIERLMQNYANTQSIYNVSKISPKIISKEKIFLKKEISFNKISFLKVKLSEPICVIDPLNTHKAYAIFHQTYKSEVYSDNGTKVLYFHKLLSDDGTYQWKISGKLWILDKHLKKG